MMALGKTRASLSVPIGEVEPASLTCERACLLEYQRLLGGDESGIAFAAHVDSSKQPSFRRLHEIWQRQWLVVTTIRDRGADRLRDTRQPIGSAVELLPHF